MTGEDIVMREQMMCEKLLEDQKGKKERKDGRISEGGKQGVPTLSPSLKVL